jgi:hypothetical protein
VIERADAIEARAAVGMNRAADARKRAEAALKRLELRQSRT